MTRKILFNIVLFLAATAALAQDPAVKYIYPDSGYQGTSFPITIIGAYTEWHFSTYFQIFFDTTGVTADFVDSTHLDNDSTLHTIVHIDGKAVMLPRTIFVLDEFNNTFKKDSALWILLTMPVVPTLILPPNNSVDQLQDVTLLWDSNAYANTFRVQVSTDSTFSNPSSFYDTVVANTPLHIRANFLQLGVKYYWRVNATNQLGTSSWSEIWNFRIRSTGIQRISTDVPSAYKLLNNYPNPFNPVTHIRFQVPKKSGVELNVYDVSGKRIAALLNQNLPEGTYEIKFDASQFPSGIYFVQMLSEGFSSVKRIALVK